jgi:hypothetical protein
MPLCLIGMEACVGAHHLSRKLQAHLHDAQLMPAKYVRAYSKGQKNDFVTQTEAVQRPTMKFVSAETADQLDLQALRRVRDGWSGSAPASSIRFVRSCWNAGLQRARDSARAQLSSLAVQCTAHSMSRTSPKFRATAADRTGG